MLHMPHLRDNVAHRTGNRRPRARTWRVSYVGRVLRLDKAVLSRATAGDLQAVSQEKKTTNTKGDQMRFLKTLWYFRHQPISFAWEVATFERWALNHGWDKDLCVELAQPDWGIFSYAGHYLEQVRPAQVMKKARLLTEKEIRKLYELAAMRVWSLKESLAGRIRRDRIKGECE